MAVLQEIKVPLISVNDTALTVIDTPFVTGDKIKQGDVILVFETSKTAYDVAAETEGYIQYACVVGDDYEVDAIVAAIVSTPEEIQEIIKVSNPVAEASLQKNNQATNWNGETLFSKSALSLITENRIDQKAFSGRDFVNKEDVLLYLGKDISKNQSTIPSASPAAKPMNLHGWRKHDH